MPTSIHSINLCPSHWKPKSFHRCQYRCQFRQSQNLSEYGCKLRQKPVGYNNTHMFQILLLTTLVLLSTSQTITTTVVNAPIIGGYQNYTDISSPQFQKVLSFIYSSYPSLNNYTPTSVQRQLVNGYNYQVNLQNGAGCTAQVSVYVPFQGTPTINSFNQDPCQTSSSTAATTSISSSNTVVGPIVVSPQPTYGGYRVATNPSGADFEAALAQALQQSTFWRSNLVLTETQVVSGTNYRFTFRNYDGTLSQSIIYVPIGGLPASVGAVPSSNYPTTGGWSEVGADSSSLKDVLDAINNQYPQVKQYNLVGAEKQVVAGFNYRVGLQSNTQDTIKYAFFNVFVEIAGSIHVTLSDWIDVSSYSVPQLIQNYQNSLQLHPEVSGANIVGIENIWQKEGLKFTYSQGSKGYRVFIYTNKGKLLNLIYPS